MSVSYSSYLSYVTGPSTTDNNYLISTQTNDITLASVIISNTGTDEANVSIHIYDSESTPSKLATVLPTYTVDGEDSQILDMKSLNITAGLQLVVLSDSSGVDFIASGLETVEA